MQIQGTRAACSNGFLTEKRLPSPCLLAGGGVGLFFALLSWGLGLLPTGHQFNDPIFLGLAIGAVIRGFLYFNWLGFAQAFGFSIGVGAVSWLLMRFLSNQMQQAFSSSDLRKTSNIAILVGAFPVLSTEIDGFQVALWYVVALMLSMRLSRVAVDLLQRKFK